jgi:hypothetical protein
MDSIAELPAVAGGRISIIFITAYDDKEAQKTHRRQ